MAPSLRLLLASSIKGSAYWRGQFDGQTTFFWNYFLPMSQSNDSFDYYDMAYGVDGYVSMFEATGATAYLDRAVTLVQNMIASAAPSTSLGSNAFRDGFAGWVSQRPDVRGKEVPLYESFCWRYVTRLLTAITANPATFVSRRSSVRPDSGVH